MKFIKTICGNHYFDFNGTIIISWIVVGNEKICVTLDRYEGETLYFHGRFKKVYESGAEGMQKLLESKVDVISDWLPKSLEVKKQKDTERLAELQRKELLEQAKLNKDRSIKLFRRVIIHKGKHKISIVTQPYQTGIYVAISDTKASGLIQLGLSSHRSTNNKLNKIINQFESEGYKVESYKDKVDYSRI